MRKGFTLKRVAAVAAAALAFGAVTVPPAPALDLGAVEIDIVVNTGDWSACGVIRDDLTSANYTAVLTATGAQSSVSRNGVILSQGMDSGNPATPCTSGGFDSSIAAVEYTLEWTSVLGTTGSMTKTCAEVPPASTTIHIDPPPIEMASSSGSEVPTFVRFVCTVS